MNKREILQLLKKDNPIILEIGTNDGEDSEDFVNTFKNIQLYCFEPDPRAIQRFKNRMKKYSNYKLYEIAISNSNGEIDFHLSGGDNTYWETDIEYSLIYKNFHSKPFI